MNERIQNGDKIICISLDDPDIDTAGGVELGRVYTAYQVLHSSMPGRDHLRIRDDDNLTGVYCRCFRKISELEIKVMEANGIQI